MQAAFAAPCCTVFRPVRAQAGAAGSRRRPARRLQPAQAVGAGPDEQKIEGLSSEYCDDFVCTSSPAVEASVRQLARDLQRANGKWTPIYASNVEYQDAFRRFKGPEGYSKLDFVPTNVQEAAVSITSMRMLDNSAAEIRWRLTGKLGMLPVDVTGTTEIWLNLLTGRIEKQKESWDLSKCSPPAAAAWNAARALWAAKRASADAGKKANEVLDTLTSIDDEDSYRQPNPNDPMKFFQQRDTFKQDALLLGGVLLLFYTLTKAWGELFSGSSGF